MTPSEGSQGEISGHRIDEAAKLVYKGAESAVVKVISRVALIIVIPLIGVALSYIMKGFEDKLDAISEGQSKANVQIEETQTKLDALRSDAQDKQHRLELQLKTIEEILRNSLKDKDNGNSLDDKDFDLHKDLGMRRQHGSL